MNYTVLITRLDFLSFSWRDGLASGQWHVEFFLGLCALAIYLLSRLELDRSAKLLWGYCLCYALLILEFPAWFYGEENAAFQASAGANAAEITLIPLFALALSRKHLIRFLDALKWIMLFELLCVWFDRKGLMVAPSFNSALVALYLPFGPPWLWALGSLTILTHHGGTAQLMLAAYASVWVFRNLPVWKSIPLAVALAGATIGIIYFHSHAPLFDGLERLQRWLGRYQSFWVFGDPSVTNWREAWSSHPVQWLWLLFGVGPATFTLFSLKIDRFQDPVVLFLHNEFLQIPWELGLTGLGLVLGVLWKSLRKSWRGDARVFYALAGLIPFAFFYHPLRWFPSALLTALIFRMALKEDGLSVRTSGS